MLEYSITNRFASGFVRLMGFAYVLWVVYGCLGAAEWAGAMVRCVRCRCSPGVPTCTCLGQGGISGFKVRG